MKLVIIIIAGVMFASHSMAASEWYVDRVVNDVQFWKNKEQKNCRVVVDTQEHSLNKSLEYYQSKKFTTDLQNSKKATLGLLGVENWTVQIDKTTKNSDAVVVDFSGNYTGTSKEKTFYRERHIYGPKILEQFLYTCQTPFPKNSNSDVIFDFIQNKKNKGVSR